MKGVVVVGSGPSGVHFAQTLLEKGYAVTMVDVGNAKPAAVLPDLDFSQLKDELPDPTEYFLGRHFTGVVLPDRMKEYYGFPPNKEYVFDAPGGFHVDSSGFEPLFSYARGGLAEAWTAGCYPFNDPELADFPFGYADLEPHFDEVAQRIGINGTRDDLSRFYPVHQHLMEPLRLDSHSARLLDSYQKKRHILNARYQCYLGRTRAATLSHDREGRKACSYTGRCLWGCPTHSLYTPSLTLETCLQHPNFTYLDGLAAQYFRVTPERRVNALMVRPVEGGPLREIPTETLVLAAGTLGSAKIFLRSKRELTGDNLRLVGLMDNRQVLVPFLNLHRLGAEVDLASYQYHQLGLGIEADDPKYYVHGLITTLTTALMHPIIQKLPLDLRTAADVARYLHSTLGVVNVNFHDTRRSENYVTLAEDPDGRDTPRLRIEYRPPENEAARMKKKLRTLRRALRVLGCIVPPGMLHVRPMGASVHYAGTLPMTTEPRPLTTDEHCRSRDFDNLFVVDGSTFPFLPAKNLTLTLMANAVRVARCAF